MAKCVLERYNSIKESMKEAVRDILGGLFHELCTVPAQFRAGMMGKGTESCQKISGVVEERYCLEDGCGPGMSNCIYNLVVTGRWAVLRQQMRLNL